MAVDLFKKIDNTVLDLQASQSQTYEGLLENLAQLLSHEDLQPFNETLTKNINLEQFLEASYATQQGMFGTSKLQWTGSDEQDLGTKVCISSKTR